MQNVDSTEPIELGEEVVTAGIELAGGIRSPYPKGLLLGQVIDVRSDANSIVQTAFLKPAANLEKLEYVLVVLDYEGGLPRTGRRADRLLDHGPRRPAAGRRAAVHPADPVADAVRPDPPLRRRPSRPRRRSRRGPCYADPRMKGIVLAGGTATRLYPLTIVTNKHLLPIYDRPMIYYPIETLAGMGIREVMVIVGGKSVGDVVELLADGAHFGLDLTYRYQRGALGIAHAIGLARDFVGDDAFCCVLGDNILRGDRSLDAVAREFEDGPWAAGTLLYRVPDPERFGVAELDATGRVVGFEEKPAQPKSDLIPIGVYFLRPDAFDVIDHLAPSGRGEFEITDVLNHYIPEGGLYSADLRRATGRTRAPSSRCMRAAELARDDDHAGNLRAAGRAARAVTDGPGRASSSPAARGSSARASSATCSAAATGRRSPSSTS